MNITFFGVRGSTPCPCELNRRYGGNTACVALEAEGHEPIVLDMGTGLRFWGETQPQDGTFAGTALVTHLHWDHVQGLPFFVPINRPGARLDIYGPLQEDGSGLADAFAEFMRPPYFPVGIDALVGDIRFRDIEPGSFAVGDAKVTALPVPHIGLTFGFRVELGGVRVAYVPDHQQPIDGSHGVADSVLELCDGVDLLIHDAQYTPDEFAVKAHWGHCTIDYALTVARESGARRLALFHHDPDHGDEQLDRLLAAARDRAASLGIDEVIAASEGLTVSFDVPALT